jgi:hypothetical protein
VLQGDFERDSAVAGWVSYCGCCAIDVAVFVHVEAGPGVGAVRTFEGVQDGVTAPGIEAKDHAAAADCTAGGIGSVAAVERCAIEIAPVVTDHAAKGRESLCASSEVVEDGLVALTVDFEDGSVAQIGAADCAAAVACDAVDVACIVDGEPAIRKGTTVLSFKRMEDGEVARIVDFEDGSATERAGESQD